MTNKNFKLTKNIAWQIEPVNDYAYIYNIAKQNFVILEDVAKDIWMLIVNSKGFTDIINTISLDYSIPVEQSNQDVREILDSLIAEGVILPDE